LKPRWSSTRRPKKMPFYLQLCNRKYQCLASNVPTFVTLRLFNGSYLLTSGFLCGPLYSVETWACSNELGADQTHRCPTVPWFQVQLPATNTQWPVQSPVYKPCSRSRFSSGGETAGTFPPWSPLSLLSPLCPISPTCARHLCHACRASACVVVGCQRLSSFTLI
jgi:hypothetical protein